MGLFLMQLRGLKLVNGEMPSIFPARVIAKITFGPEDAFGIPDANPRTTIQRARPARMIWNANEGTTMWEAEFIQKVETSFTLGSFSAGLNGDQLTLTFPVRSFEEAHQMVVSANQFLPALLSFRLNTLVWIKQFEVDVAGNSFRFEIPDTYSGVTIATAELNRSRIIEALEEWIAAGHEYRRVIAALYYFRHAERLAALEPERQSMVAEVLLNLTKALEIIFSSDRDRLRCNASKWGFDKTFIEEKIIPLLLLRNEMDVAHVATGPLTQDQRRIVVDFTQCAISHVHSVLERVVELIRSGDVKLDPVSETLDKDKHKLLQALEQYLDK